MDKILYNLKNVHYALTTVNDDGTLSFGEVKRFMGTTELTIELEQSSETYYSEGMPYATITASAGYKGELTVHNLSEDFEVEVLGLRRDAKGAIIENINTQAKPIALLFEIDGDEKGYRVVIYRMKLTRPKLEYKTNTSKVEVQSLKMSYVGLANEKGDIRVKMARTEDNKNIYDNWFKSVYVETATTPGA